MRPVRCLHFTYLLRVPITCCLSVYLSMALITLIKSCPKNKRCSPSTPHLRAFKKDSCSILRMADAGIPEKYVVGQGNTWSPLLFKKKTTNQTALEARMGFNSGRHPAKGTPKHQSCHKYTNQSQALMRDWRPAAAAQTPRGPRERSIMGKGKSRGSGSLTCGAEDSQKRQECEESPLNWHHARPPNLEQTRVVTD